MRDPVQIAAIAIAVVLMAVWYFTVPRGPAPGRELPVAPRGESPADGPLTSGAPRPVPALAPVEPAVPSPVLTQAKRVVLENDALRVELTSQGARVSSVWLLEYRDRVGEDAGPVELVTAAGHGTLQMFLGRGELEASANALYQIVSQGKRHATFRWTEGGLRVERRFELDRSGYGARLSVSVANQGQASVEPTFELAFYGRERPADAPDRFQNYQLVVSSEDDLERKAIGGIDSPGFLKQIFGGGEAPQGASVPAPVEWAGIDSQYFLLAALPENEREASGYLGPVGPSTGLVLLRYPAFQVPQGRQVARVYRLYLGPKLNETVAAVDPRLEAAVNVGWRWVRPLVRGFEMALVWSHDHLIANYGVGIILLTILLRVATFPLTQKSMTSMKRFGQIAPLMKELQEKHKGDKEKLSAEMMSLYKREGINPVSAMGGGCLPMLIQMPFMIALYFALQGSIELRHAPFMFWIQDLSAPENFLSIAGLPIRPLPLLMGGSMLLQQRLTPTTGDPQQRQMMMWMSVIFTFMFYQFPSGLLLYWFVSNLLGIGQQYLVNRRPGGKNAEGKRSGGVRA